VDSEKDIDKAAARLMEDNNWSKLQALSTLLSRYKSQRRLEEAVIVQRIIDREKKSKAESNTGFYDDM
jgi:hypothetical protein